MAYLPHTLFVMGGTLTDPTANDKEIWQCTMRGVQVDNPSVPVVDPVAFMNGVADPLATWFHAASSQIASYASLDFIKVNTIGPDGKYANPSTSNQHDYSVPAVGASSPTHPFTESFCYSWGTAKTRGPGSHGRIYLPNCTQGQSGSAVLLGPAQALYLISAQNLIKVLDVGDGDESGMLLVIASKVNATNTPVDHIRIGRVVDSQRRRRDALPESYISGPAHV